jgi:hypothetical protein
MTRIHTVSLAALLAAFGFAADALAVCDQTAASQADRDLWDTHGCREDFFLWQYVAYDMRAADWGDRGWNDACNVNMEYPKHWNAAYLLTYGLLDNNDQSFHGTIDYRAVAEAAASELHDGLYHAATDATNIFGSFTPEREGPNRVDTSCLLYDSSRSNSNPASRAGDFLHEGWHGWLRKGKWNNGSVGGHRPGPQGQCTINGCDYFYFHGIADYAFGALYQTDGTAARFHSPNQVQVEFLCDVADQSQSWVPASVRQAARSDANTRATQRFINGPGYSCGDARPW